MTKKDQDQTSKAAPDEERWEIQHAPGSSDDFEYAVCRDGQPVAYAKSESEAEFILIACRAHSTEKKFARQIHEQMKQCQLSLYLLDRAIASTRTGIVIADVNQADLPLIYVNPAFETITGYSVSEAVGRNCRFLQGADRDQPGLTELRAALQQGRDCNVVLRNYRKDQTPFWNELHISPIHDDTGRLTHFVGVQTDVTERVEDRERILRLQEDLLEKNSELERLNETKNQFLGMAAHDLRNPLSGIVGYGSLLSEGLVGALNDQQRNVIERILNSSRFMVKLVNDLLDVSKIEAGKLELELESVDLCDLIRECLELNQPRAREKEIEIVFDLPEDGPSELVADRNKITQVLDNLITNAIKFSNAKSKVDIGLQPSDDQVTLFVRDQGQGIVKEELDHLFKPFSRTSTKSTGGEKSTGLGLVICKKIVEGHGGQIWVESEVGKGTTFYFSLSRMATA